MTIGLVLAAGLLFQIAPAAPNQAMYLGRPVAEWISELDSDVMSLQTRARKTLLSMGKPAVPSLIAALSSPRAGIRDGAAELLGSIGDTAAMPALLALLADGRDGSGYSAARALGKLRDERAVEPLLASLRKESPSATYCCEGQIEGLGEIGSARALDTLARIATRDFRQYSRLNAVKALGKRKDVRSVEPLVSALKDWSEQVRAAAVNELKSFGAPRAIELLEAAAADPLTGAAAASALRDVDIRGKRTATVGDVQVTLMGLESAQTWERGSIPYAARKGNEYIVVRFRLQWLKEIQWPTTETVELFDTEGAGLKTVEASEGVTMLKSLFGEMLVANRVAGEAMTITSAFVAKKGTKLGKCVVEGATFNLDGVVPVPRKEP